MGKKVTCTCGNVVGECSDDNQEVVECSGTCGQCGKDFTFVCLPSQSKEKSNNTSN